MKSKLPLPNVDDFIGNIAERVAIRVAERVVEEIPSIVTEAIMLEITSTVKSVPMGVRNFVVGLFRK